MVSDSIHCLILNSFLFSYLHLSHSFNLCSSIFFNPFQNHPMAHTRHLCYLVFSLVLLPIGILISLCSYCPYIDAVPNSSPSTTAANTCSHIINFMCWNSSRTSLLAYSAAACWTLMDNVWNLQNSFRDVIWRILHPDLLAGSQLSHLNL